MSIVINKKFIGELNLKQLTAPSELAVSVAEQKLYSRIDGSYEDSLIQMMIEASIIACESYCKFGFVQRAYEQSEDVGGDSSSVILSSFILSEFDIYSYFVKSIESLIVYDIDDTGFTIDPTRYRLDRADSNNRGRLVFDYGDTTGINNRQLSSYKLNFTAGFGLAVDVPSDIKLAIMMTANRWYEDRETMGAISEVSKNLLDKYRAVNL